MYKSQQLIENNAEIDMICFHEGVFILSDMVTSVGPSTTIQGHKLSYEMQPHGVLVKCNDSFTFIGFANIRFIRGKYVSVQEKKK